MSQFADGGGMASKPYCATGAYLDRMGNACKGCRYDPKKATGPDASPFTTLYRDFLTRHEKLLARVESTLLCARHAASGAYHETRGLQPGSAPAAQRGPDRGLRRVRPLLGADL